MIGYNFNMGLLLPGLELLNGGSSGGTQGQSGGSSGGTQGQSGGSGGGGSGQNSGPLAASAGPAESGNQGSPIGFDGSVRGGSGSDSYSWNFGDGSAAVTGTLTPSHTYAVAGNYTVTLTASDGDSSQASTAATVHNLAVNAGGPYSGTSGSSISFTATASDPADTSGDFTYSWSFGDGGTASGANVSYTYLNPGNYTATVTVTEPDGFSASANAAVSVLAADAPNEPLLYSSDLQYVGAFRVPNVGNSSGGTAYGGTAIAYNPADNSLFLVGYGDDDQQPIAEISIPSTIVNSDNLSDLTSATFLQPWTTINIPNPLSGASDGTLIGGLMVDNGQLIGTQYAYYSGAYAQTTSDFVLNSLNLSTAQVQGLYPVEGGRLAAGYITPIPSEWQGVLGAPDLIGASDIPIISTVSSGPAALGFNPNDLSYSATAPSTTFLDYPTNDPLGPYTGAVDPLQNGVTGIGGAVFVPGTSTVLFVGQTGTNYVSYGPPGVEAPWSFNGQESYQVWAYNANDLLAVKQGTMQPWQVQPYDVWNFTFPFAGDYGIQVGGVAFDPSTDRLYVSFVNAEYDYTNAPLLPMIGVYQLNIPSGPPAAVAPQVGTLAATPSPVPSPIPSSWANGTGSVSPGTSVLLTAGNVYAITPGANITQVAFYLDTNNDGVLETGSDQLLGDGTPSTIPNAENNYTLTMSTAGLTAGTYNLFVQATDSNGQVSNVVETTLTIS
ncbi:MAG: PKD domain-containing protein [Gemmataceae bacterium]